MTGILPTEVQWRVSKARLSSNFQRNLVQCQPSLIKDVASKYDQIKSYIDISNLNSIYERYVVNSNPQGADDINILNSTVLSLWLERF